MDGRRLSILIGTCVVACQEALRTAGPVFANQTHVSSILNRGGSEYIGEQARTYTTEELKHDDQDDRHRAATTGKLLLTVREAAQYLSIGRPKMYELVMRDEVLSVKLGASRRIPAKALEEYVDHLTAAAAAAHAAHVAERREQHGQ